VNNLDESRLVTWAVHKAWRFIERAKREARRRPLAAITQNIVDDSSLNIINAGKNSEDNAVLTEGRRQHGRGCAKQRTHGGHRRRAAHCSTQNSKPAARGAVGLLHISSSSQRASRRTARGAQLGEQRSGHAVLPPAALRAVESAAAKGRAGCCTDGGEGSVCPS
jgi:hypothetical protein